MNTIKSALVTLVLVLLTMGATAQTKSNVLKTNLFSPILKTYWLSYERLFNDDAGVQLGFFYTGWNFGDTKLSGFALTPEARFYLSESAAPKGIYLAPGLRYSSLTATTDATDTDPGGEATVSTYGGALIVGAQTLLKEVVTIEAYIGPSYSAKTVDIKSGVEEDFDLGSFEGFGIRIGVTLGVAF